MSISDIGGYILLMLLPVTLFVVGVWVMYHSKALRRKFFEKDISAISEVDKPGLYKVAGSIVPVDKPLKSIIDEKECVFYWLTIEYYNRRLRHPDWEKIMEYSEGHEIVLEDDSGQARVLINLEDLRIVKDSVYQSTVFSSENLPPKAARMIQNKGYQLKGKLINIKYRVTESYLVPGDRLVTFGYARRQGPSVLFKKYLKYPFLVTDYEGDNLETLEVEEIVGGLCMVIIGFVLAAIVSYVFFLSDLGLSGLWELLKSTITDWIWGEKK